jgi:hypothetical protein
MPIGQANGKSLFRENAAGKKKTRTGNGAGL